MIVYFFLADVNAIKLTNGLFLVFCLRSKKCLGFFVLVKPEGVGAVRDMIFARFKKCPYMIVYDRGCLLAHSMLIREPAFVKHCRFSVDSWHIYGHINCGTVCHPKHYGMDLSKINTQLMEQVNKWLRKAIETSSHWMNSFSFIWHVRHMMYLHNIKY
jgi:hypothetical protein